MNGLPAITGQPTGNVGSRDGVDRELYFAEVEVRFDAYSAIVEDLIAKSGDPDAARRLLAHFTRTTMPLEEKLAAFRAALREAQLLGRGGIKALTAALGREATRRTRVGRAKRH